MPTILAGGSIWNTRSNSSSALLKTKMEDENKKLVDTMVKDSTSAVTFLIDGEFKSKDDEMSFKLLSVIAMQLLQQVRNPKLVLEAFKALLYLILDTHQKMVMDSITDSVAKAISTATKRIRDKLDITMDQLVQAAANSTEAGSS